MWDSATGLLVLHAGDQSRETVTETVSQKWRKLGHLVEVATDQSMVLPSLSACVRAQSGHFACVL